MTRELLPSFFSMSQLFEVVQDKVLQLLLVSFYPGKGMIHL